MERAGSKIGFLGDLHPVTSVYTPLPAGSLLWHFSLLGMVIKGAEGADRLPPAVMGEMLKNSVLNFMV